MQTETTYWMSLPIEKLERMIRAERARALAGSWAYDLARHRNMLAAYRERTDRQQ